MRATVGWHPGGTGSGELRSSRKGRFIYSQQSDGEIWVIEEWLALLNQRIFIYHKIIWAQVVVLAAIVKANEPGRPTA